MKVRHLSPYLFLIAAAVAFFILPQFFWESRGGDVNHFHSQWVALRNTDPSTWLCLIAVLLLFADIIYSYETQGKWDPCAFTSDREAVIFVSLQGLFVLLLTMEWLGWMPFKIAGTLITILLGVTSGKDLCCRIYHRGKKK